MQPTTQPSAVDPSQFGQYSDWAKQNMDRGVDANTLLSTLNKQGINPNGQSKDSGNFFTNLLPTIGSIAAPVIGAALAPETGGLSLLASAALSGIGGAGGQIAENALEGKNPFDSNVLSSGLLNAGAGAAGGVLSKVGGKVLSSFVKPNADKAAVNLLTGQGGGALGKDTASYLYKGGVKDLSQMKNIAPLVTQGEGAMSNGVKNLLYNADEAGARMNLSSFGRSATKLPGEGVNTHSVAAGLGEGTPGANNVQSYLDSVLQKYNPNAITSVAGKNGTVVKGFDNGVLANQKPSDVLAITQDLDKRAAQWIGSRSPDVQLQGQALRNISNQLKNELYGPDTAIGKMGIPTEMKQQMINDLAPLKSVNPQYYNMKVSEINSAKNIGELRSSQQPEVLSSQALDAVQRAENTQGSNVSDLIKVGAPVAGMSMGGPAGAAAGYVAGKALGSKGANVAGVKALSALSDMIGNKNAQKLMSTLTRAGVVGAANLPSMASGTNQSSPLAMGNLPTQEGGVMKGAASPLQDYLNNIETLSILNPSMYGGMSSSLLSAMAPTLQKNQALQSAASMLPEAYGNAGGGQGFLQGGINTLAGLIPGTPQNAYQGERSVIAAQLASALGISPQEAQNILPTLMQGQGTGGQRLGILNAITSGLPQ